MEYGFQNIENEWYEKDPNTITKKEFENLLIDFNNKLKSFDGIWFYYNPPDVCLII